MSSGPRRKQQAKVGPEQLIRLEGSSSVKRSHEGAGSSLMKESHKRMKGSADEIIIGKNHVNPALILHLAKSGKDEGMSKNKINAVICQALRQLKTEKTGSEKAWFMSLVTLAKLRSDLFTADKIVEVLCGYLERDHSQMLHKGRNSSLVPVLSWSLLMTAYKKHENWPEIFVKMYVNDAITDRIWIENPMCKQYCNEIVTVFGTVKPSTASPTSLMMGPVKPDIDPIVPAATTEDTESNESGESSQKETPSRFKNSAVQDSIRQFVVKTVNDYLVQKKQVDNMTRNFVKFLCTTCGYKEIRQLAVARLDNFLNSTKLSRPSQDLLSYLAANTRTGSTEDLEVVQKLAQLRIKSKPLANFYTLCMKELMTLHPSNIEHLLRTVIWNELSANRNSTNMQLITGLFQQDGEKSAIVLAHVFQELLLQPEDCLRSLRVLLREIVRCLHYELKFSQFALALMQEITLPAFRNGDAKLQERMFLSLNSLVCLTILLSCKPSIKEIALSSTKTDVLPLIKFQNEVAVMQKNAVWWLHKIVPAQYRIMGKHYYNSLRQVLFLDDPCNYAAKDNWPGEGERDMLVSLCAEVPLLENTLMRLGVLGTAMSLPLRPQEVLGLINSVVRRAAMLDSENDVPPPLQVTGQLKHNLDIIQMLIKLSEYKCYNVKFPEGYTPPQLVISSHYWRAWQILLILAAFNPTTVGVLAWENHPTLRGFMEMVITNNYQFPPNSMNYQDAMMQEKQLCAAEESDILIFEGHLAAARGVKINRANSQLLNQLMVVKEGAPMRKPPQGVLDQARLLAMELHLGHRLCKIREPDFLLDIIKQQGTRKSMSWLSELVKSSENSFELLPVPCLCEFLLQDIQNTKRHILLKRLQSILTGTTDSTQTLEIVQYFISKMSASYTVRYKSLKGLKTIFNRALEGESNNEDWLLVDLVNIPQHEAVCATVCLELRKALKVEQSISLLSSYLIYICQFCGPDTKITTAHDIASCIILRNQVMIQVLETNENVLIALLDIFCEMFAFGKELGKGDKDGIGLKLGGSIRCIDVEVVQAVLILLAQARGRNVGKNSSVSKLMSTLFPSNTHLNKYSTQLCTDTVVPILVGSSVKKLQDLAMKSLTHEKMISLLKEFSLPETAAQFILEKLDTDIEDVAPLLIDEEELLAHVQAWRISVSGGEQIEAFLTEKTVIPEVEVIDYYAEFKKEEPMEAEDDGNGQPKEWSDIYDDVFTKDSIEGQSHLLSYCVQSKNIEEICLTLFLWLQNNSVPSRHENFVSVMMKLLADHCNNKNLMEKLLCALSTSCSSLGPLHQKLFPATASPTKEGKNKFGVLMKWCEAPQSMEYPNILKILDAMKINEIADSELCLLGNVWQKVLKTAVRNNGTYGISLEPLINIVANQMSNNSRCVGMFMDWLQVLSPELDCFKMFLDKDKAVPVSMQRYLLNMICSSSGWETLHECINCLLCPGSSSFNESLILDFLQGCSNNERIWQGANSKRGTNKGSLRLKKDQLWRLCELIMCEASNVEEQDKSQGVQQDRQFIVISWRLPLILSPYHTEFLSDLVCKLQSYPHRCSKILSLSLYLAEPSLFSNGPSSALINSALSCTKTSTACDSLIHQLITNVCDRKKNSASGYILLRRLAASHPPFILRHLDLITSALGNPSTFTKNEFMQGNYGQVFVSIIGILDGLGSHLFQKDATKILAECLDFVILHTKADARLYTPTIIKLCHIFGRFLEIDRTRALKVLQKDRLDKLKKVEVRLRDPVLSLLLDNIANGTVTSSRVSDFDENQMAPYLAKMCSDSAESLAIMQDLEAGSIKKPAVLKMFLPEICRRMVSDSSKSRSLAHKLVIRHIRQVPRDSAVVFPYIEEALQHSQQDVVKSAIMEIPELILLSGPEAARLMRLAFQAVASAKIDMVHDFMILIKTIVTSSDLF